MNMIKKTVAATLAKSSKKAIKRPVYRYQPLMVKVGTVSLSPRGDWRMPSDAAAYIWMKELENINESE